ncbi:MAG: dockerin type I domain-containing protein [Phycisphaerales bacterium]|nr:dockerin type I domain-containing protein [Phycisphaerales bacterium]
MQRSALSAFGILFVMSVAHAQDETVTKIHFPAFSMTGATHYRLNGSIEVIDNSDVNVLADFVAPRLDLTLGGIRGADGSSLPIEEHSGFTGIKLLYKDSRSVFANSNDAELWPLADPIEDLFVHAVHPGTRADRIIVRGNCPQYMTFPTPDWQNMWIQLNIDRLNANTKAHGIFMDNGGINLSTTICNGEPKRDSVCTENCASCECATVASYYKDNWSAALVSMVENAKAAFGEDLLIANSIVLATYPENPIPLIGDGAMDEAFIGQPHWGRADTPPMAEEDWLKNLEMLEVISSVRIYLAGSGSRNPSLCDFRSNALFTYGSFLLGAGPGGYWNYAVGDASIAPAYSHLYYWEYWDLDLGEPLSSKKPHPTEAGIWYREYENMTVVVNVANTNTPLLSFDDMTPLSSYRGHIGQRGTFVDGDINQIPLAIGNAVILLKESLRPNIDVASSVKAHGTLGLFVRKVDVLNGKSESRSGGVTRLNLTFSEDIEVDTGTCTDVVVTGANCVSATLFGTNKYQLDLSNATDESCIRIEFPGVHSTRYHLSPKPLNIAYLIGDANGDGVVDTTDNDYVSARFGQPVNNTNARADVNRDNIINALDQAEIAQRLGNNAACIEIGGISGDCNSNHVPDECEDDCNGNEVPDDCDIAAGTIQDLNANGLPDDCEPCLHADVNCDGNVNALDLAVIQAPGNWGKSCATASVPRADINRDGVVNALDLAAILAPLCWATPSQFPGDCSDPICP